MREAPWRSELRARQSAWREIRGLPIGHHNGRELGSRLAMPDAEAHLWNFLTPAIGGFARAEYDANLTRPRNEQKVYGYPRLFEDLLSSQPMAFNLFGELALDLDLGTRVARVLWPTLVGRVERIDFEWSPGRWDRRYLDNGSAADVAIFHTTRRGGRGAILIETKYHEDLAGKAYPLKPRYFEVASSSRAFAGDTEHAVSRGDLQQFWFDHLLALATMQAHRLDTVLFSVTYPTINSSCVDACSRYRAALTAEGAVTFEHRTLEEVVTAIATVSSGGWVRSFSDRYLTPSLSRRTGPDRLDS